ncbi:MAG TPA: hypothetical protein VF577_07695 [Allosphingosinicella sp.]
MRRILFAAASVLALAACGPDADENPGDLNVVDNFTGPGNVLEPPTGNGSTVTPTENGLTIEFPAGNETGNGAAPAGNTTAPPANMQ